MELKTFTYYKTGGTCAKLLMPESLDELRQNLSSNKLPLMVLGLGSNTLVMDEPWDGAALLFRKMKGITFISENTLHVEAGVENSDFAAFALKHNFSGAGWMNGLPGEMGGTVRMNARCYGGEISQIVSKVYAVTRTGALKTYDGSKHVFRGYKDTIFMENGEIIAAVDVDLHKVKDTAPTLALMEKCKNDRMSKGQYAYPSCGCVFKNDYSINVPAGMLLEAAGAKSLATPTVRVSEHHANFVYNLNAAPARDILELTFVMREAVFLEFGVWLEYEMEILGRLPKDLQEKFSQRKISKPNQKVAVLREVFQKKNALN